MRLRAFVVLLAPPTSGVVRPSLSRLGVRAVCGEGGAWRRLAADGLGLEGFPERARMLKPGLLPVVEAIFAVTGVDPGQALHQRLAPEKASGSILQAPFAPEVLCDFQAPRHQSGRSLDVSWSAGGARDAEVRAGGTCPDELEVVLREGGLVIPLGYVNT